MDSLNGYSPQQSNSSRMGLLESNMFNSSANYNNYDQYNNHSSESSGQYSIWGAQSPCYREEPSPPTTTATLTNDTLQNFGHLSLSSDGGSNSMRPFKRSQNENNRFSSMNQSPYSSLLTSTNTMSSTSGAADEYLDYEKTLNLLRFFEVVLAHPSTLESMSMDPATVEALMKPLKKHLMIVTPPSSPTRSITLGSNFLTPSPFSSPSNSSSRFRNISQVICSPSSFEQRFDEDEEPRLWVGNLPFRNDNEEYTVYSPKLFVGGLPLDITKNQIINEFKNFSSNGNFDAELPKDNGSTSGKRHCYLIFSDTEKVKALLLVCDREQDLNTTTWHYFTSSGNKVEIIPWITKDNHWSSMKNHDKEINSNNSRFSVFVGGVYGKLTAEHLAIIFDNLFGAIACVNIDTDRFKYPRGSARIVFNEEAPYLKAIKAHKVEVKANGFMKTLEINPYIHENAICSICKRKPDHAPMFCKTCLDTYCSMCVAKHHNGHQIIQRNSTKPSRSSSRENSFSFNTSPKRF